MNDKLKSRAHMEMLIAKKEILDQKIHDEEKRPLPNDVLLHKMKREKLQIRDEVQQMKKAG